MPRFALVGAAGFVAAKHLGAIRDTGNSLAAACDTHDSVGILDAYFPQTLFFGQTSDLSRYMVQAGRQRDERIDYLAVCSPTHLHAEHTRMGLEAGVTVICEKPLTNEPKNLDSLQDAERKTGRRVYTVLQLRYHPALLKLKGGLDSARLGPPHKVRITYVTPRGQWYGSSWKGDLSKSGGLALNIGVHMFDILIWLFGSVVSTEVQVLERTRIVGNVSLERANVEWFLSIDPADHYALDPNTPPRPHRSMTVDGLPIDFSSGIDLHRAAYQAILRGEGLGIDDARPSIELASALASVSPGDDVWRPYAR